MHGKWELEKKVRSGGQDIFIHGHLMCLEKTRTGTVIVYYYNNHTILIKKVTIIEQPLAEKQL